MLTLVMLFIIYGCLLIGLSLPLILRWVRPNRWYGFRVRRTIEDPELWYAVNAYAAWWLLGAGVVTILVATLGFRLMNLEFYAGIVGSVAMAGVLLSFVQGWRSLEHLSKDHCRILTPPKDPVQ